MDFELILCAFEKNKVYAVSQLLARFEDKIVQSRLTMVRYLISSGIPKISGMNSVLFNYHFNFM
jgi:hypothetical protein